MLPVLKKCSACKEQREASQFFRDKSMKDGLHSCCKVCANGKTALWRAKNAEKVAKQNAERLKAWRVENKDRYHQHAKEWAAKNPDKVRDIQRANLQANRQHITQRAKKWRDDNHGKYLASKARRRAAEFNATPSWANEFFMQEAYALAKQREKATGIKWEVDHIVPLNSRIVCGLHAHTNLQVIPMTANRRKSNTNWPDKPYPIP